MAFVAVAAVEVGLPVALPAPAPDAGDVKEATTPGLAAAEWFLARMILS